MIPLPFISDSLGIQSLTLFQIQISLFPLHICESLFLHFFVPLFCSLPMTSLSQSPQSWGRGPCHVGHIINQSRIQPRLNRSSRSIYPTETSIKAEIVPHTPLNPGYYFPCGRKTQKNIVTESTRMEDLDFFRAALEGFLEFPYRLWALAWVLATKGSLKELGGVRSRGTLSCHLVLILPYSSCFQKCLKIRVCSLM